MIKNKTLIFSQLKSSVFEGIFLLNSGMGMGNGMGVWEIWGVWEVWGYGDMGVGMCEGWCVCVYGYDHAHNHAHTHRRTPLYLH